jgi:uncharacterized protein
MESLIRHLVEPIVAHPDDVSIQSVEGESVVMLELVVHPDDAEMLEADRGKALRSIRNILSAAAGRRKASLDLVDEFSDDLGEE